MTNEELAEILEEIEPNIRFTRLLTLCEKVFGKPRIKGSHHFFSVPWGGPPYINLQRDGKDAKPYQVKQVR